MLPVKDRAQRCAKSKVICDHLSMTQEAVTSCLIVTSYKKQSDKIKFVEARSQFCFINKRRFSIKE